MIEFVDPRSNPEPPPRLCREPAAHGEELRDLIQLCLAGRVYDVERWIQDGRPIQALSYKRPKKAAVVSPLRTAIRKKHRDLVLLLMCNGYRLDLETNERSSVLDEALALRAFDILNLLLEWGADPSTARTYNIIDTYRADLIDRFWKAGVDYSVDPEFGLYLAHTVNKPLYGWMRRNRSDQHLQDALDVALLEAVTEMDAMPDLEAQFSWAHDSWTLKKRLYELPPVGQKSYSPSLAACGGHSGSDPPGTCRMHWGLSHRVEVSWSSCLRIRYAI